VVKSTRFKAVPKAAFDPPVRKVRLEAAEGPVKELKVMAEPAAVVLTTKRLLPHALITRGPVVVSVE
jgi:hypothetical protein